jgi:hypothetical protein
MQVKIVFSLIGLAIAALALHLIDISMFEGPVPAPTGPCLGCAAVAIEFVVACAGITAALLSAIAVWIMTTRLQKWTRAGLGRTLLLLTTGGIATLSVVTILILCSAYLRGNPAGYAIPPRLHALVGFGL